MRVAADDPRGIRDSEDGRERHGKAFDVRIERPSRDAQHRGECNVSCEQTRAAAEPCVTFRRGRQRVRHIGPNRR